MAALVVDLGESPPPGGLRGTLAEALGDPGLVVAYPVGDGRLVDADGAAGRATPRRRAGRHRAGARRPRGRPDPAPARPSRTPGPRRRGRRDRAPGPGERAPAGRGARPARGPPRLARPDRPDRRRGAAARSSATSTTARSSASSAWPWGSACTAGGRRRTATRGGGPARRGRGRAARRDRRAARAGPRAAPAVLSDHGLGPPSRPSRRAHGAAAGRDVPPQRLPGDGGGSRLRGSRGRRGDGAARVHAARRGRRCSSSTSRPPPRPTCLVDLEDRVGAFGGTLAVERPARRVRAPEGGGPVRVVIADDAVLLREGLARLLAEAGIEVVGHRRGRRGACSRARRARRARRRGRRHPHAADVHRRGHRAAAADPRRFPAVGVLVLSQHLETAVRAAAPRGACQRASATC